MRIEKYGWSKVLGYGFLAKENFTDLCFVQLVKVEVKSPNTSKVFSRTIDAVGKYVNAKVEDDNPSSLNHVLYKNKNSYRTTEAAIPQYNIPNVFVVYDGEARTWREYFTGIELIVASVSRIDNYEMNISSWAPGLVIDAGRTINGIYDTISITEPQLCDAIAFSEAVKQFSKEAIERRARQLFSIKENAAKWGEGYDRAVKDVKIERSNAEKNIPNVESDLAAGFGRYANVERSQEQSNSQSVQQESENQRQEQREYTRQLEEQRRRAEQQHWNQQQARRGTQPFFGQINRQTENNRVVPEEVRQQWIKNGRCAYCGGELRSGSILKDYKCCSRCGRVKS